MKTSQIVDPFSRVSGSPPPFRQIPNSWQQVAHFEKDLGLGLASNEFPTPLGEMRKGQGWRDAIGERFECYYLTYNLLRLRKLRKITFHFKVENSLRYSSIWS